MEEEQKDNNSSEVNGGKRFFIILLIGLLCCINGAVAVVAYPMGLYLLAFPLMSVNINIKPESFLVIGYVIYIALLVSFISVKKRGSLNILTWIMVILTCINIAGCQQILTGIGSIGN